MKKKPYLFINDTNLLASQRNFGSSDIFDLKRRGPHFLIVNKKKKLKT